MKIKEIYINGFNNIKETRIFLSELSSLVALNNYGKSNVLKAIKNFEQVIKTNNLTLLYGEFSFNRYLVAYPIELEFVFSDNEIEYRYYLKLSREYEKNIFNCEESLFMKKDSTKFSKIFERIGNKIKYKSSLKMDRINLESDLIGTQENELALKKLSYNDNLDYFSIIQQILNFNVVIAELQGIFIKTFFKEKNSSFNTVSGEGFEKVLYDLYENRKNDYFLLENLFKKLIPEVESISIEKRQSKESSLDSVMDVYEEFWIYVKEKSNLLKTPFAKLSLGSQRIFILLLILIYFKDKNCLILFEELENCIHPKLFQSLIKSIELLNSNVQLLITSHSPYIIQYIDIESTYLGIPNEKSVAKFISPSKLGIKKIRNYAKEEGISTGEFIFNLLLEDVKDNEDLQEIIGESWKNI